MIPTLPKPRFQVGTRLRVVQSVRVGDRAWRTEVVGTVEREALRPVGGMEMGGKAVYCHQPTLRLRKPDGEITVVAVDEDTLVEELAGA